MEMCFGHITVSPDTNGNLNLLPFYHDIDRWRCFADPDHAISRCKMGKAVQGVKGADSGDAYGSAMEILAPLQVKHLWESDFNAIEKAKDRGYQLYLFPHRRVIRLVSAALLMGINSRML